MKVVILALCVLGISGCEVAGACDSYDDCLKIPNDSKPRLYEQCGKCDGSADCRYVEIPSEYNIQRAMLFKLDEINDNLKIIAQQSVGYVKDDHGIIVGNVTDVRKKKTPAQSK